MRIAQIQIRHQVLYSIFFKAQNGKEAPTSFIREIDENMPKQKNSKDCGVFVLCYAKEIAFGRTPHFDQQDIPHARQKIIHELLTKSLI